MKKKTKKFVDKYCDAAVKCPYKKGRPVKLVTEKDMYYIDCQIEDGMCPNEQTELFKEKAPPTITSNTVSSFIKR